MPCVQSKSIKRFSLQAQLISLRSLTLCALFFVAFNSLAATPQPFIATYNANYSGINVSAVRSLKATSDQLLELRFEAKSWIASITEFSQFRWSEAGNLTPQHYTYERKGLGRERQANLTFNWDDKTVINDVQGKSWSMDLPEVVLDKLGYQLQLRNDLINQRPLASYKVADGGRLKTYQFKHMGSELLNTSIGPLKTTKVERVREDSKRTTQIWFADDWDYLIIKLQQTEKDGKKYEINLTHATVNGQTISGLTK
jgi:hypothetical protein